MRRRTTRTVLSGTALLAGLLGSVSGMASAQAKPVVSAQPALVASVPCSTAALVAAINAANASIAPSILTLAPQCTYLLTAAAKGSDGLPVIIRDITLVGSDTTIARPITAPAFRIAHVAGLGASLTIQGITVTGGVAGHGGCLLADNSGTLVVQNSIVTGCAGVSGGAIFIASGSSGNIAGGILVQNQASNNGGAIDNEGRSFVGASRLAQNEASGAGGGIYNHGGLQIDGTTIDHNQAGAFGGGIADFSLEILRNSAIAANVAGLTGGGIFEQGSTTLIITLVLGNVPNNCAPGGTVPLCFG